MLKDAKAASAEPLPADGIDIRPYGYTNNASNFQIAAEFAWQQRILPKPLALSDLFDEVTSKLD